MVDVECGVVKRSGLEFVVVLKLVVVVMGTGVDVGVVVVVDAVGVVCKGVLVVVSVVVVEGVVVVVVVGSGVVEVVVLAAVVVLGLTAKEKSNIMGFKTNCKVGLWGWFIQKQNSVCFYSTY